MRQVIGAMLLTAAMMITTGCVTLPGGGGVTKQAWGEVNGERVSLYTLRNNSGAEMTVTDYGGTVVSLKVPDRNGKYDDVVLGFDSVEEYIEKSQYFGCITGRYANRIAKGKFTLDGKDYTLAINNDPNTLHGGTKGFDKVIWNTRVIRSSLGPALEFTYTSRHMEEGYPGNLTTICVVTLTHANELRCDFTAITDKATVVNLTHHSYFNLSGAGDPTILDHEMMINADKYTPVDKNLIPTGIASVKNTPLDFTKSMAIGKRIEQNHEQLKFGLGYDHNYVINDSDDQLKTAAEVYDPDSGRVMTVLTTEPGIQFYCGNFLNDMAGKAGKKYPHRSGFCLEPQHYPDSPNQPNFPSTILKPGDLYQNTIIYRFSVR